ncbi:MAG: hypothetical protein QGM50_09975 [Anaerolineae bacterium]|nr:hypothetical protein [Anaerolineae bacterium]
MHIRKLSSFVRNAIILTLVFILASEPILVAAQPAKRDPRAEAMDLILKGGETYIDSAARATFESAELFKIISAIQSVPLQQLNEAYLGQTIERALSIAEDASIALGAADDLADGIEQIGGVLPGAIDIGQAASQGLPDQLRSDLIAHAGLSPSQADQLSASILELYSARQSAAGGLPAGIQADLLTFGFTQAQIDEIAIAVGQRGLVNPGLDTRLAQFRAAQDELADVRSGMLVLAVQLLGYQIAVRQYNGIQPRAVTDAELDELSEDELRLLIHVAHLDSAWGDDPNAEVGAGDWWFIEHFAARVADRLEPLIVETQNRALVAELFIVQQMRTLAISARSGDAAYAKAELENLAALLAYRLEATEYYQQLSSPNLLALTLAKIAVLPALREHVAWPISGGALKNAKLVTQEHMRAFGVQNLAAIIGSFDESDETNNQGSILIVAGLQFSDQLRVDITQVMQTIKVAFNDEGIWLWLKAILTGNTDNPALLTANVILSFIPVLSVIIDLISLVVDPSIGIKVLSLIGVIAGLGDVAAFFPGTVFAAILTKVADVGAAITKGLFRVSKLAFRSILDTLKFGEAFDVMLKFFRTAGSILFRQGLRAGDNILQAVTNLFTGSKNLWGNFVTYVRRVGAENLVKLGFDEGGDLVGRILNLGVDLSDEALAGTRKIGKELADTGLDLSNEAAEGLGKLANSMDGDELQRFVKSVNIDQIEDVSRAFNKFDSLTRQGAENIANKVGGKNFGKLMSKYADDPDAAERIFNVLGNAIDDDSLKIAMNQGSEAINTLSYHNVKFLNDKTIAKELAQRAGKDTLVLQDIATLKTLGPIDPKFLTPRQAELIANIAKNSTNGSGNRFMIGFYNDFDGGYIKVVRDHPNTYKFYSSHPNVYDDLGSFSNRSEILELINKQALEASIVNKVPFEYSLFEAATKDKKVIDEFWDKGILLRESGASDDVIENALDVILNTAYPEGIPSRMKELKLLFFNGYGNKTFDAASNLFRITP